MKLRVGTRRSPLARVQAQLVCEMLRASEPGLQIDVVAMETSGDRARDRPLRESGGKALFTKELDEALLGGAIHCAVHSLKDVPATLPAGIVIGAVPPRADARDALITVGGKTLDDLPEESRIGTSSPRRAAQLLAMRPQLHVEPLRGNVETRLRKVLAGEFDATLLAMAGLQRLALELRPGAAVPLGPESFVPAAGQGALCVTARSDEAPVLELLRGIEDRCSRAAADAERSAARALGGSCWLPVGAYAGVDDEHLRLVAVLVSPDGRLVIRREGAGESAHAEHIGQVVGQAILDAGGDEIVKTLQAS